MSVYGTPAVKIVLNTTDPSGSFILNQYAGPQTGNFWVTGKGRVDSKLGIGGVDPTYALHVTTTDPIAASFSGRVIGADAVNANEFITKAQMDATVGTPPTLLATQVGYGSTGNTLTGSGGITFTVGTGKLTLNTAVGRLIQLGNASPVASANPVQIHMGGSYSDTVAANLKLVLYDNNIGGIVGFGMSSGGLEYVVPTLVTHKFYSGTTALMSVSGTQIGVLNSLQIVWEDVLAPKLSFYGLPGSITGYNMGVASGGILYSNVATGGKHALRINGVEAFSISGAGAAITTVSQDDTKTAVMVWDAGDKLVRWRAASSIVNGLTAITANNGLTATTISNVQLGAASVGAASPLLHDTFINTDVYKLEVNGAQLDILRGSLMAVNSGGGTAFYVSAYGGANANSNAHAMRIDNLFTSTNTVEPILQILRSTAASGGVSGVGGSIDFRAAFGVTGGNNPSTTTTRLISKWTTAGSLSQFIITGVGPGGMADLFTLHGTGSTQLNKYGIGTFPGTAAFNLAVDSTGKLIEVSAAAVPPLAHALLGVSHSDTVGSAPVRGGLIVANATPAWAQLAKGTTNQILQAGATDVGWVTISGDIGLAAGVATIPNNTVTYAKMQDISQASVLLGRGSAGGAGDPQEILLDVNSLVMNLTTVGVKIQMSITADTSGLKFVNDAAAPGNSKYYGTSTVGVKGYYDLPTSIVEGEWNFATSTTMADPGSGKFRTDNVLFSASLGMTISDISAQGIDRTPILQTIQINDLIYIQDKSNAANWVRYRVTGPPLDNGTYWFIPIVMVEGGGTAPTNNSPCLFHFTGQAGAGALAITQLTGDVTAGPGSGSQVATIANNAVTYAKMQDVTATNRFIGRISAGAGDPQELTGTQATTLLDLFSTTSALKGLVPGSNNLGINVVLRGDGTWGSLAGSGVTGAALTKTDDTNVTLTLGGTPATALLAATSITVGWTGVLGVTRGGTGLAAIAQGDLIYGSAANTFSILNKNATATRYLSNIGASNNPAWSQVDLSNGVTGTLPSANLGNGLARSVFGVTGNAAASRADIQATAADQVLVANGAGTAIVWGTVATGGITNSAVTYAKIQNVTATSRFLGRITAGAGLVEELTGTQATTLIDLFSTTTATKGVVPGSAGVGSTFFLRADGTWAVPPGAGGGGYTTLSQFVDETAWRIFYSNAAGDVTPLAFGTSGQVLQSTGATSAPIWATAGGSGTIGGTIAATQVGYGSGANTLTSSANFTFVTGTLALNKTTGINIQLGDSTSTSMADPVRIDMGGSYSSTAGANPKLILYNSAGSYMGLGVSLGSIDYIAGSGVTHKFYAGHASGWTLLVDNVQLGMQTGAVVRFYDSVGEKIRFYGSSATMADYTMGVASATLYYNVTTGAKHSFQSGGVEAFSVNSAGTSTITTVTTLGNIGSLIQLAAGQTGDALQVRANGGTVISSISAAGLGYFSGAKLETVTQDDAITNVAVWDATSKLIKWRNVTTIGGTGTIGGTLAATQVAYGSAANTITGSNDFNFAAGKLTLSKTSGVNLYLGVPTQASIVDGAILNLGGNYTATPGTNPKLILYDNPAAQVGIGFSSISQIEMIGSAGTTFAWFQGSTMRLLQTQQTLHLLNNNVLSFDGTSADKIFLQWSTPNRIGITNTDIYYNIVGASTTFHNFKVGDVSSLQIFNEAGGGTIALAGLQSYRGTNNINFRAGYNALANVTTASYSVAIGYNALTSITTQGENTVIGAAAGTVMTGTSNVAVGVGVMGGAITGTDNVAIGNRTMSNAVGNMLGNIAIGSYALNVITTGGQNIAMGMYAGTVISTGTANILIGYATGGAFTTANYNVIIGNEAGRTGVGINYNVMIGFNAGYYATGSDNVFIGGNNNATGSSTGSYGVSIGASSRINATYAIAIGHNSNATDEGISIGYNSSGAARGTRVGSGGAASGYGSTAIGYGASASGSGAIVIGNYNTSGTGNTSVTIGYAASAVAEHAIAIGTGAYAGTVGGVAIGNGANASHYYAFAVGYNAIVTGENSINFLPYSTNSIANSMTIGGAFAASYILTGGNGHYSATPAWFLIRATSGTGTDIVGGSLYLDAGSGTGAAVSGSIFFRTSDAVGTGTTAQAATTKMEITATGVLKLTNVVQDNSEDKILVWNSTDKMVQWRAASTLGGGSGGGYTAITQFVDEPAWAGFYYANGSGDMTALALGTTNQVLQSTGISSAPIWVTLTGGSTKFGKAGEDDTAGEDRLFNLGNHTYRIREGAPTELDFWIGHNSTGYSEFYAQVGNATTTDGLAIVQVTKGSTVTPDITARFGIYNTTSDNADASLLIKKGSVDFQLGSATTFKLSGLSTAVGTKTLRYDPATGIVTYHDIPTGGGGGVSSFAFTNANGFSGSVATATSTPTLTLSTSLTLGSVPFIGAAGALLQDNALHFWDNTNKRLGIGTNAPLYTLQVTGSIYALNNFAHNAQGGWAAFFSNTTQVPASSSFTSGYTWAGGASSNTMQFAGSSTINQGAIIAGHTVSNRTEFTAASATITMTQAAGIRALAGLQILSQTLGAFAGTVSHGASLMIQGVYPVNSTVVTFQNYYGILINTLDEWGVVALTNRWAIYQQGASDPSYFAGRIQINNVTSQGAYMLQVTGGFYVNATSATMRFVGLSTDNAATQVLAKNASGDNVWRDISSISGGAGGGENLDATMAIGSNLTTSRSIGVGANELEVTGSGAISLQGINTGTGVAIQGLANGTGISMDASKATVNTTDIIPIMHVALSTTDTPIAGIGSFIRFFNPSGIATSNQAGWIAVRRTVISTSVPQDDFEFWTQNAGTMAKSLVLKSTGHLLLGNLTSTTSATPISISLGGTYSTTVNTAPKLALYDNGSVQYGIGVAASVMFYTVPAAVAHRFYVGTVTALMLGVGGGVGNYIQSPTLTDVTLQLFVDPSNTANAFEIKTGLVVVHSVSNAGNGYYAGNLSIANAKSFSGRIAPRIGTVASSSSLTIDSDAVDMYTVTALAATMVMNNPSGTPVDGQKLMIRIEDNGTTKTLTWSGTQWRAGDMALPLLTVATKIMYLGFTWHATDSKWDFIAYTDNF